MQQEAVHTQSKNSFIQGAKDCIPTLLGYLSIGFAFGVVGTVTGLSLLEVALVAIFIYAGAAQFILCALLVTNTPALSIVFTVFVVNLRHFLMSLTIAPYVTRYSTWRNIGFGTLLTDETFGVAVTEAMKSKKIYGRWLDGLNITAYVSWIIACVAGGYFGHWITDVEKWGLDFALVAMFIALLVLQLSETNKSKLHMYLKLIMIMFITVYILLNFLSTHITVLLATLFVATLGVWMDK